MVKKNLLPLLVVSFLFVSGCTTQPSIPKNAHAMWRCNATDSRGMHWFQYSPTRVEAANLVRDQCNAGSYQPTCVVHCFPPKRRWHCVAVDKKGHTWYWNSTRWLKAIQHARRACKKHSTVGGCRVPSKNCKKSL